MELRQLRYFVMLARELNFTRAAQRLHIVQPALSQQIKELERELDVTLFNRNKRNVELTGTGKVFLQEAERTLAHATNAVTAAKRAQSGIIGKIEIGYSSGSVLSGILGAILQRYRQQFPEVELSMKQVYPATQMDMLLRHEVDVIFGMSNSIRLPSDCELFPLATYPLHVMMPEGHKLVGQKAVRVSDLREEPFISHSAPEDSHGADYLQNILGFSPHISHYSSSFLFMRVLIEAGFGLAIMPTVMASAFAGAVVSRPLSGAKETFDVSALVHKARQNPAVKNLVDIAIETARR